MLSGGETIPTRCVIWGGGLKAAELASRAGLATGRGGRIDVMPDLTVADHPGVYVVGDIANAAAPDGSDFPQLGSVALQEGRWAAKNILADIDGKQRTGFHYHDKGIMAMIGRGRRGRRGRRASPRAARPDRVLRVAGRARRAAERRAPPR